MDEVPGVVRPIAADGNPMLQFYTVDHFATTATDLILLSRLTGDRSLEPLVTGHIAWVLGLNPGVPQRNIVGGASSASAWGAAAFVYNLDAPFARGFQSFATPESSVKRWLAPWEAQFTQHEAWWVDPFPNGFMSLTNGHVVWDGQWDYYNAGEHGWGSGETFLLSDALFIKASLLYEAWLAELSSSGP
jgi:hypothetical protein